MSVENRNSLNSQRRCSFCRIIGHRITKCNDERFLYFERRCVNLLNNNGFDEVNFRNFLLEEAERDSVLIKAFAIRKCNLTKRHQIDSCIENIVQYFIARNQALVISSEIATESQLLSETINSLQDLLIQNISIVEIHNYILFIEAIRDISRYNESPLNGKKFNITTNLININENLKEKCECSICYESCEKINFIELNCKHEFCKDCVKKSLQNEVKTKLSCAFCRCEVTNFGIRDLSINDEINEFIET